MDKIYALASAHWQAILYVIGVWTLAATVIAKRWPAPAATAPWELRFLHWLAVDLPSWIATQDGRTWMGLRLSIPFLTWTTQIAAAPAPTARTKDGGYVATGLLFLLAVIGAVGFLLALPGCAHGTTGLRQACANQMDVAAAGFRAADAWYSPKLAAFKSSAEARDQFVKDDALYNKVRAGIKAESAQAKAECSIADAVDSGGKGDVGAATAAVGQSIANIGQLLMSLQPLLSAGPAGVAGADGGVR